ncbi:MAG: hypothetical protein PHE86_06525 [Candidatus Marinimicrobia bacterium]|nr:hypothetical protein [Candidatus Neomarinimicrobiota bacterium]MDD5581764.1 hypothetical protein [Candidatus Neomarinimicrobiota bacterium]
MKQPHKYFMVHFCLKRLGTLFLIIPFLMNPLQAQEKILFLKEGRLWETVHLAKTGPIFASWARSGYGMDYPGFDIEWVAGHIGDAPSHHVGGGFWIGALDSNGTVMGREDYALYAGSVGFESTAKYIATKHGFITDGRSNFYYQQQKNMGEIALETEFSWNPNYLFPYERKAYLPIKVNRKVYQWPTHERDQDYIIFDYTVTNIGDSTMFKTYVMFLYGFSINARGWSILFPNYNPGARNTRMLWDQNRRLMYGYATDFKDVEGNETYDFWADGGPDRQGEYLAPAYAGIKFLYVSPDSSGEANRINNYGWSASHPTQASNPFTNKGTLEEDYAVLKNPANATDPITSMGDDRWGKTKIWSMVSLGPWDIEPGDSIRFVIAEVIGSVSYNVAVDPNATISDIAKGRQILLENADAAQANFEANYTIPMPPAAPNAIELDYMGEDAIGVVIRWDNEGESIPDADYTGDEAYDLVGYRIYRSNYLPIGPWTLVADISKKDTKYFDAFEQKYSFADTNVINGEAYYYAVTAYDTGHGVWPPNPDLYPNGVPPLETSKYINRTTKSFRAGYGATEGLENIVVVPNPFVLSSGLTQAADADNIQFRNIPAPCTIRIYTIRGDLVKVIEHTEAIGSAIWDQVSDYGQFVESGVFIYHITSHAPESEGDVAIGKFSIIR